MDIFAIVAQIAILLMVLMGVAVIGLGIRRLRSQSTELPIFTGIQVNVGRRIYTLYHVAAIVAGLLTVLWTIMLQSNPHMQLIRDEQNISLRLLPIVVWFAADTLVKWIISLQPTVVNWGSGTVNLGRSCLATPSIVSLVILAVFFLLMISMAKVPSNTLNLGLLGLLNCQSLLACYAHQRLADMAGVDEPTEKPA